jgi:hypothetical protein
MRRRRWDRFQLERISLRAGVVAVSPDRYSKRIREIAMVASECADLLLEQERAKDEDRQYSKA